MEKSAGDDFRVDALAAGTVCGVLVRSFRLRLLERRQTGKINDIVLIGIGNQGPRSPECISQTGLDHLNLSSPLSKHAFVFLIGSSLDRFIIRFYGTCSPRFALLLRRILHVNLERHIRHRLMLTRVLGFSNQSQ